MASHNSGNKKYTRFFTTEPRGLDSVAIIGSSPELRKKSGDLAIPSQIGGKQVVEISDPALAELRFATVYIPATVAALGLSPFFNCRYLKSIEVAPENPKFASRDGVLFNKTFTELVCYPIMKKDDSYRVPDGVTKIRGNAFRSVVPLKSVFLPQSVEDVDSTFIFCASLSEINVAPENLFYSSEDGALFNKDGTSLLRFTLDKKGVSEYVVPPKVKNFGFDAFAGCRGVRRIVLSESFEDFGDLFCASMEDLESIDVSERNRRYSSVDGVLFNKDKTRLVLVPNVKGVTEYVLPREVREIAPGAFDLAYELEDIETGAENEYFQSEDGVLLAKEGTELVRFPRGKKWWDYATPEGVVSIGDRAFFGCGNLACVVLSEDVRRVGEFAFGACSRLQCVHMLGALDYLGSRAFCFCMALKNVVISEGLKEVLPSTFEKTGLASVRLPESVETIREGAFCDCRELKKVVFGKNVKNVALLAFIGTPATLYVHKGSAAHFILENLSAVAPPFEFVDESSSTVRPAHKETDPLFFKTQNLGEDEVAIIGHDPRRRPKDGVVVVPAKIGWRRVVEIQNEAFACLKCSKIVLPATLNNIEELAFFMLMDLEAIEVSEENEAFASADGVLFSKDMTELICYPTNKSDEHYIVPATVTTTRDGAFMSPRRLLRITIGANVEEFEEQLTLFTSVVAINVSGCNSTYASCDGVLFDKDLEELVLYPKGRPQKKYMLPASCEDVEEAFIGAFRLEEIEAAAESENFSSVDGVLFNKCQTKLVLYPEARKSSRYVVPETVLEIGSYAFYHAINLHSIELPSELESIEERAFTSCQNLRSIVVPKGVRTLGTQTFCDCSALRSVELPDGLETLDFGVFMQCGSLLNVDLPEGFREIGEKAFFMCGSLKSVFLPASVESVAEDAFEGSSPLLRVIDGSYAHRWAIEHDMKFD